MTSIDHPGSLGTEESQYDAVGNLLGKKDGNGAVTAYEYDVLNRVTKVKYNYGRWPVDLAQYPITTPDVTYSYYKDTSSVLEMVDSAGTTAYDYDHRGRMTDYTPAAPSGYGTIEYTYDNANNKTTIVSPQGATTYTYYRNGWLAQVSANSSAVVVDYDYDAAGNRTLIARNNGTETVIGYDARNRVSSISHNPSIASVTYTRDGVGSPLTADWENDGTWNVSYGYDAMNRLERENHSIRGLREWDYDWVGNRLDAGFVYDPATDELLEGPSGVIRQYSTAGSMTNKAGVTYGYNAQELLTSVGSTTFNWDGEAKRVRMTCANGTYQFVYDPTAGIPAVLFEDKPSNDTQYVREPDGSLVASVKDATVRYYHFDTLGSTIAMTDSVGMVTDRYDYSVWGEEYPIFISEIENPYRFAGQLGYYTHWQYISLADYLQLGVRFYNPVVSRFDQIDPIRYGVNLYIYADNSPGFKVDPTGLLSNQTNICLKEALCVFQLSGVGWGIARAAIVGGCLLGCACTGEAFVPCVIACVTAGSGATMAPWIIATIGAVGTDFTSCMITPPNTDKCGKPKYNTPCLDTFPKGVLSGLIGLL